MSKVKYTVKKKLEVINYVLDGHSCNLASHIFDIGLSTIRKWVKAYKAYGMEGIKIKKHNPTPYNGDFRVHVVEYMHEHLLSGSEAAILFNIPSSTTISQWEAIYLRDGPAGLYLKPKERSKNMKDKLPKAPETRDKETLAEENRRLRMEVEYLKKLNALIQEREEFKKETK